jgi:riboflavin-specific deaminase-like protein
MKPLTQHRDEAEDPLANRPLMSDVGGAVLDDLRNVRARARVRIQGRPFVTVAYAQSVDGSITIARGQRYALSGAQSLRFTHALRANHAAILVGVGTVMADDPELRVRLVEGPSPQPVIVDSRLRTPVTAKLFARTGRSPWIGTTDRADDDQPNRRSGFEALGCRILACPAQDNGWVDVFALLRQLHAEGIADVMVEGGARIITSFLDARLVDYAIVTIAPVFLGGLSAIGRGAGWGPVEGPRLDKWTSHRLGDDLVLGGEVVWPGK